MLQRYFEFNGALTKTKIDFPDRLSQHRRTVREVTFIINLIQIISCSSIFMHNEFAALVKSVGDSFRQIWGYKSLRAPRR